MLLNAKAGFCAFFFMIPGIGPPQTDALSPGLLSLKAVGQQQC